jgi:prepilin signal peptidase PulO-like enzyme (type II secretory pathway)
MALSFMPLIGGLLGMGMFLLAYLVSGKKLGLADIWYAGLIGIVLEPLLLYAALGVSCVLAIGFILISKKRSVPFIPFMAAGSFAVLPVWGVSI